MGDVTGAHSIFRALSSTNLELARPDVPVGQTVRSVTQDMTAKTWMCSLFQWCKDYTYGISYLKFFKCQRFANGVRACDQVSSHTAGRHMMQRTMPRGWMSGQRTHSGRNGMDALGQGVPQLFLPSTPTPKCSVTELPLQKLHL